MAQNSNEDVLRQGATDYFLRLSSEWETQYGTSSAAGSAARAAYQMSRDQEAQQMALLDPRLRDTSTNSANNNNSRQNERLYIKMLADMLPDDQYGDLTSSAAPPHFTNMKGTLLCAMEELKYTKFLEKKVDGLIGFLAVIVEENARLAAEAASAQSGVGGAESMDH